MELSGKRFPTWPQGPRMRITSLNRQLGDGMGLKVSNAENRVLLNRREALLLSATAGVAAALPRSAHASESTRTTAARQGAGTLSTPRSAIARTQYGKVRGYLERDVLTFKGVPYGQNTGGENRWLPAKPPLPWKDEYPALTYGANNPQ